MGLSRKFMVINLGIIFFNAVFGILMHMAFMNIRSPIRERYIQLPDESLINEQQYPPRNGSDSNLEDLITFINDIQNDSSVGKRLPEDMQGIDSALFNNETISGGCQAHSSDKRSSVLDPNRAMNDHSRTYKIHPFTVTGENWSNISRIWQICLSTQTSVDNLFWISKQAEMWDGPLSVSIYTPDVDYTIAVKMILYLQTCFPEVKERVTFHMIYPKDLPPVYVQTEEDQQEYDCDQAEAVNSALLDDIRTAKLKEIIKKSPYPQNLLRNLARKGCHSEYSFTPDIDMISIPDMSLQLNEFVSRRSTRECDKCAFIIPTYEIHSRVTTNPKDKKELKALIRRRKAQRFHIKAFAPNQANSRLIKWEKKPLSGSLDILYNITTWRNYWEPIYVAKATVPLYDERFVGYGFTRNSQVYEMHVADYTWHMLNNVFLCHRGFQRSKWRNTIRKKQIKVNSEKYKIFRQEIYARYGKKPEDYEPKTKKKVDDKTVKKTQEEEIIPEIEDKPFNEDLLKEDNNEKINEVLIEEKEEDIPKVKKILISKYRKKNKNKVLAQS